MMVPLHSLDTTLQKRTDVIPSERHVEDETARKGVFQLPSHPVFKPRFRQAVGFRMPSYHLLTVRSERLYISDRSKASPISS